VFFNQLKINNPIVIGIENGLLMIPALSNVMHPTREHDARSTTHNPNVSQLAKIYLKL
jgi:hypothetical protein